MDTLLKQRIAGAIVLIGLLAIFLPMLLSGSAETQDSISISPSIPAAAPKPVMQTIITLQPEEVPERHQIVPHTANIQPQPMRVVKAPENEAKVDFKMKSVNAAPEKAATNTAKPASEKNVVPDKHAPALLTKSKAIIPALTKPNPQKAVAAASGWVIQVGSFADIHHALNLQKQLRSRGFSAFVKNIKVNDKVSAAKVFVGPVIKKERAVALQIQLEKAIHVKGSVIAYEPIAT